MRGQWLLVAVVLSCASASSPAQPETPEEILRGHGVELTETSLSLALKNPQPFIRGLAAWMLAYHGMKGGTVALERAAESEPDPTTRTRMRFHLADLRGESRADLARLLCMDRDPAVRVAAAQQVFLANEDEQCFEALLDVVSHPESAGESLVPALYLIGNHEHSLAQGGAAAFCSALEGILRGSSDAHVRLVAAHSLAASCTACARDAIERAVPAEVDADNRTSLRWTLRHWPAACAGRSPTGARMP